MRQDVRSDGSRIEGSHKGWNSIQRSFSSGIELFTTLSHDHVLRTNCRIAANSKSPSIFTSASYGTHHVRLATHIATQWNTLIANETVKPGAQPLTKLPGLKTVSSGEKFGLVVSKHTNSFKGLLEIKQELKEEEIIEELTDNEFDPVEVLKSLNIDPGLVNIPQTSLAPMPSPLLTTLIPTPAAASLSLTPALHAPSVPTPSPSIRIPTNLSSLLSLPTPDDCAVPPLQEIQKKRKYEHTGSELTSTLYTIDETDGTLSSLAKKPRVEVVRQPVPVSIRKQPSTMGMD